MKIAIASGKGGTGKTTLSTNLAAYLAEKEEIVLCDLDVEEPNSGLFINGDLIHKEIKYKMIPEWNAENCILCGNCKEVCNYHAVIKLGKQIMVFPELCHSCYACSELCPTSSLPMQEYKMGVLSHFQTHNLHFIESRLEIGQEQAVPMIKQSIDYVEQHFGSNTLQIFDSPPGTSCPVIEATKDADFILLVTEPTPFGFHDLNLAIETMKELKKEFAVVINRDGIGNDEVEKYCEASKIPIIAKIPNMRQIAELYFKGKLIYQHVPEFMTELKKIQDYLIAM